MALFKYFSVKNMPAALPQKFLLHWSTSFRQLTPTFKKNLNKTLFLENVLVQFLCLIIHFAKQINYMLPIFFLACGLLPWFYAQLFFSLLQHIQNKVFSCSLALNLVVYLSTCISLILMGFNLTDSHLLLIINGDNGCI